MALDWKYTSEVFYNFAVSLGAIGGGIFAGTKVIVEFILTRQRGSYKNKFKKLYPRESIGVIFKVVDTDKAPGKLYLIDLKKKERYWIQSSNTLLDLNLFWDDAKRISEAEFEKYKEGPAILTSGTPGS